METLFYLWDMNETNTPAIYNIYTHNGSEITKAEAVAIIGLKFVEILLKENEKNLNKGYDIYNAEMQIAKNNSLNVRSSYKAALL